MVVITGYHGTAIRSFFGDSIDGVPITYVEQSKQLGLGHAVLQAQPYVDGPFVILNGDNVVAGDVCAPIARQQREGIDAVVTVESVDQVAARKTGGVSVDEEQVTGIVEKLADPPSTLATTGCYVLPAEIFDALQLIRPSEHGEYELADAIGVLIRAGACIEAVPLKSDRVNVNTPDRERLSGSGWTVDFDGRREISLVDAGENPCEVASSFLRATTSSGSASGSSALLSANTLSVAATSSKRSS